MYAFRALGHTCDVAGPNGFEYSELDIPRIAPSYDLIIVTENYPLAWTDVVPRGWKWWRWDQISTPKIFWAFDTHIHDYRPLIQEGKFDYVLFAVARHYIEYSLPRSHTLYYALSRKHQWLDEVHVKQYDCVFLGTLGVSPRRKILCERFGILPLQAYGVEYFRTMKKARICFNNSMTGDINAKYFEIMGSGTFMLTNYNQELLDFVHEHVRDDLLACMYRTDEEIGEKIKYYLEHEDEREAIAKRLYDYVWAHHTWEARAERILTLVQR